jgi:hypothetical protein
MKVLIVGSGHVGITGSELASRVAHELPHLKIVAEPEPYVLTDPYAVIRQTTALTFAQSGQDNRRARRKKERQTKKKRQCQSKKQSRKR